MARAVHKRDLHLAVRPARQLRRQAGEKGREAEVQRDPALLALRVLIKGVGRRGRGESAGSRWILGFQASLYRFPIAFFIYPMTSSSLL